MFLDVIAKVYSILVMVLRNANKQLAYQVGDSRSLFLLRRKWWLPTPTSDLLLAWPTVATSASEVSSSLTSMGQHL
jgi:hypothetical protein